MKIMRRREALVMGGAATLLAGADASAQEPPKPAQIVVNHSGGAMGSAMRKAFFNGFEKKYGIRVVETSPADFGKLRAMVESGNVEWDVTEIGGQDAIRATKMNLVEKIDDKIVDRSKYPEKARSPYVFASSVYTTIIGYRTDVFKDDTQPKSWADWWDVKKFPGTRSMRDHPTDNLEFALIADGVPMDKIYPIDFDRAFKKLDQIKPHVSVWWSTGQQPAQLLLDKEVVLATGWNGRFYDLIKKGGPIAIEWNQGALKQGSFVIPTRREKSVLGTEDAGGDVDSAAAGYLCQRTWLPRAQPRGAEFRRRQGQARTCRRQYIDKQFWIDDSWYAENGNKALELWNAWKLKKG